MQSLGADAKELFCGFSCKHRSVRIADAIFPCTISVVMAQKIAAGMVQVDNHRIIVQDIRKSSAGQYHAFHCPHWILHGFSDKRHFAGFDLLSQV